MRGRRTGRTEYRRPLGEAGFIDVEIEPTRITTSRTREFLTAAGLGVDRLAPQIAGRVRSAFIRALPVSRFSAIS
ncbi:MAG TPA: hypothetical protein VN607_02295 [Gemmatimonadaceae bacterium]|nr:hypothetical protein [Gemmatimonadaceae bacterium]